MICQQERKEEITTAPRFAPLSNTSTVAIVGDIDITKDIKKVITKMKQNSQVIFL